MLLVENKSTEARTKIFKDSKDFHISKAKIRRKNLKDFSESLEY